ncbi:hypothetical protein MLD38_013649 [Melastoma candidum]|uniref:Uncharacterized protein n=1 Tax=Melastoma candidum TaxID=119954 RepID=A0ACB9RBJ8_9MYRT|nr:hypothetical protein MLD38_013649 [Melastoma candidum]
MMKKVARKLKFWSRKKKRKKSRTTLLLAPSFPCDDDLDPHYSPSAPPLPPWVEVDYDCGSCQFPTFQTPVPFQMQPVPFHCNEEASVPILAAIRHENKAWNSNRESEHRVPDPGPGPGTAYGAPGNAAEGRGERGGLLGCLVRVGANMFGCLFPCLTICRAPVRRHATPCTINEEEA